MSSHEQSSMAKGRPRGTRHPVDLPDIRAPRIQHHPSIRRHAPAAAIAVRMLMLGLLASQPVSLGAAEPGSETADQAKTVIREAAAAVDGKALDTVAGAVASISTSSNEPILIRAATAWEDDSGEVLYLEGDFHMRTSEWEVSAERAEVHGPVEDPEKIIGYGKPASIRVTLGDDGEGTGYSNRIVYLYRTKMLELHDDARMEMDNVTVRSAAIIYDVGRKRLVSSGKEGVEFVLQKDNTPAR